MNKYPYFKPILTCADGTPAPEPLIFKTKRTIRFEEVDSMRVVWHGRYPSYLEDVRVAFGDHFGIGYSTLIQEQTPAPVRQMFLEYLAPLRFGQTCTISIQLHWSDAARMNYTYTIHDDEGVLTTTGFTVQMFISSTGQFLLDQPDFYAEFCNKWKNGEFK